MTDRTHLPYSKKGLEDLAVALGIDSAYLWVNPTNQRLDVKQITRIPHQEMEELEMEELEETE